MSALNCPAAAPLPERGEYTEAGGGIQPRSRTSCSASMRPATRAGDRWRSPAPCGECPPTGGWPVSLGPARLVRLWRRQECPGRCGAVACSFARRRREVGMSRPARRWAVLVGTRGALGGLPVAGSTRMPRAGQHHVPAWERRRRGCRRHRSRAELGPAPDTALRQRATSPTSAASLTTANGGAPSAFWTLLRTPAHLLAGGGLCRGERRCRNDRLPDGDDRRRIDDGAKGFVDRHLGGMRGGGAASGRAVTDKEHPIAGLNGIARRRSDADIGGDAGDKPALDGSPA